MILIFIHKIYRYGIISVPVLLLCLGLIVSVYAETDEDTHINNEYIDGLIKKARKEQLWKDPQWLVLLHYKKNLFGIESLVDDPKFFFSVNGKTDPEQEMYETIRVLFSNNDSNVKDRIYKYTARCKWLKNRLYINDSTFVTDCDQKFESFYNELNPTRIALVFPAGYMNSPASMFGHTFLMIESGSNGKMMAKTANYAAITDETFGPIFAFKGLFGLYHGYFSFLPYYKKIQEYNDGEMRDMWEYELDLSEDEIKTVLRHIVEMEDIYSEYYFIDENCSFNLLYLVEVARPDTSLTDSFGIGVEPIDTLRVVKEKNLVLKRTYRPSLYSKIQYLRSLLTDDEQEFVLAVCNGEKDITDINKLNTDRLTQTVICDLCTDYLKFMAIKNNISESEYRTRFMSVLTYRNTLPESDNYKNIPVPIPPEDSHSSRRISAGSGYGHDGWYSILSYRQTCHELMDPDEGYNPNSQIVFGGIEARYYYDLKKVCLQRFDIINLLSLPYSDSFYINPCYELFTGFTRNVWDRENVLSYVVKGSTGFSTLSFNFLHLYILAGFNSSFSGKYENNTDLQFGSQAGIITVAGFWKNHMFFKVYTAPFGIKHTLFSACASERITINRFISIMAEGCWTRDFGISFFESSLKICLYY